MTATILKIRPASAGLRCSECGANAKAACNCGAPYIPAGQIAAKAVAANPEKSNVAIARDVGISEITVRRARASTSTNVEVDKRIGLDGRMRRVIAKPKILATKATRDTVNRMSQLPTEFTQSYIEQLDDWLSSKPSLTSEAITTLANALHLCAEEFERMARHVEKQR